MESPFVESPTFSLSNAADCGSRRSKSSQGLSPQAKKHTEYYIIASLSPQVMGVLGTEEAKGCYNTGAPPGGVSRHGVACLPVGHSQTERHREAF